MNKICLALGLLLFVACASTPDSNQTFNLSEEQYETALEPYTDKVQKYDGPYNVLDVSATLLNSAVIDAQTLRQATMFQWDKLKHQAELQKKLDSAKEKTEVFVSFFTPDKKSGDLLRSDTLWKTILRFENKELVGKPKKLSMLPIEIKSLFPNHNQWSTGYIITFDIPVKEFETLNSELVITGPVGVATLKFQANK